MKPITTGMISQKKIQEFKELYLKKFNVKLTDTEATRMAIDLVNLMRILVEPDKKSSKA